MESNIGGKCLPSDSDSDSDCEKVFHNEFFDSEDDSNVQSVRDCNVVDRQNEADSTNVQTSSKTTENFEPTAIFRITFLTFDEPETNSLNDLGTRNLLFVPSFQTNVPHHHKKTGRNKNNDGGKPKSVPDTLKKDSNPRSNCDDGYNTDIEDFRSSDKFFGEKSEDFVSRRVEPGHHHESKTKDSLCDTAGLSMVMEGNDRSQSTNRDFENNSANSNEGNEATPIFDKRCQQNPSMSVQENLTFTDWNSNWTTDDFLLCPTSISKVDLTTSSQIVSEAHHNHSGRDKTQKRRMLQMFHDRKKKGKDPNNDHDLADRVSNKMIYNPLVYLAKKAKEKGADLSTVLQVAEPITGMKFSLPCMQCYEANKGRLSHPKGKGHSADMSRCANCGGQIPTLQSLSTMIVNTRKLLKEKHFELYDVYPDGNCMLRSIVDQLRVRGNFRYTNFSLRAAAVDYLRRNPNAEDGTPLEMFLSGETWEEYLIRMSEDGQWGDHLVLKAISNVLQMCLVIYGGLSVDTETKIEPENMVSTDVIHLLHMEETHYVSLRPKNWRQQLLKESQRYLQLWEQGIVGNEGSHGSYKKYPMAHLDFILRCTYSLEYINSFMSENIDNLRVEQNTEEIKVSLVGPIVCKLAPTYINPTESIALDGSLIFPEENQELAEIVHYLVKFKIPIDSAVHTKSTRAGQPFDLIAKNKDDSQLLVHLIPVDPANWETQILPIGPESFCLKTFELPDFMFDEKYNDDCVIKHQELVAFQCQWPDNADEWSRRRRSANFPSRNVVQSIKTAGCHVIPVLSIHTQRDVIDCVVTQEMVAHHDIWCLSFAEVEKQLCKEMLDDQRRCYLVLYTCLDSVHKESPIPTSFLKSVFFYACEHIEKLKWKQQPAKCLLIMIDKLIQSFESKVLPHYFIPSENLIRHTPDDIIASWIFELKCIQIDPLSKLYFTFDSIGLTSTEVGGIFDDVIDDLLTFNRHKSLQRSFQESLVPAAGTVVQSLVYMGQFQYAMNIVENICEDSTVILNKKVSLVNLIKLLLSDMAIGYKWCLAFFIDMKLNRTITEELCRNVDCLHITEIFGPEIVDEMPNTVVPIFYGIPNGDLVFPTVSSNAIEQTGNMKLLAKCLRYYLDTYSSIAGDNITIDVHVCGCRDGQYCAKRASYLFMLLKLYVTLFDAYMATNQVESFRELMPLFTRIADSVDKTYSYSYLGYVWEKLGDSRWAAHYRQKSSLTDMEPYYNHLFDAVSSK